MSRLDMVLSIVVAVLTISSPSAAVKIEVYREEITKQQNPQIRNYIIDFEQFRQQCSDVNVQEAMTDMKLLVIQRWITTFEPDIHLLTDVIQQNVKTILDEVNKDIIRDLKERNEKNPVYESIKLYSGKKEGEIQEYFAGQVATLKTERYELLTDLYGGRSKGSKNIGVQYREKSEKLSRASFNNRFHPLAKMMAIDSYNIIFEKSN